MDLIIDANSGTGWQGSEVLGRRGCWARLCSAVSNSSALSTRSRAEPGLLDLGTREDQTANLSFSPQWMFSRIWSKGGEGTSWSSAALIETQRWAQRGRIQHTQGRVSSVPALHGQARASRAELELLRRVAMSHGEDRPPPHCSSSFKEPPVRIFTPFILQFH